MDFTGSFQQQQASQNFYQFTVQNGQPYNVVFTIYPNSHILNYQPPCPFQSIPSSNVYVPSPAALAPEPPRQLQEPPASSGTKRARKQCPQKELESARKNSESNLVNQLLAFIHNSQMSQKLVRRTIRKLKKEGPTEQKMRVIFYNVVRLMTYLRGRKYVNRMTLLKLYRPQTFKKEIPNIEETCASEGSPSIEELCLLFRVVTFQFLRQFSVASVLTSKRISQIARSHHLQRRRVVVESLAQSRPRMIAVYLQLLFCSY